MSTPRSVRANNPGNIRIGTKWVGLMDPAAMTPEQAAEHEFCVFETSAKGFRAMATIIRNYKKLHHVLTLRGVIGRWAPPTENNTGAYLNDVCNRIQKGPDDPFDFEDDQAMMALCKAIAIHEGGGWFFSDFDLQTGIRQAA